MVPEPNWKRGTLGHLSVQYRAWLRKSKLAQQTQRSYNTSLAKFHGLMHRPLEEIKPRLAYAVVAGMGDGASYTALCVLSAMMSWGVRSGLLEFNPLMGMKKPTYGEWEAITQEELKLILQHTHPFLTPVVLAAALTGQRKGDLMAANIDQIDRKAGVLWFVQSKTKIKVPVPITPDLDRVLRFADTIRPPSETAIFIMPNAERWTNSMLHYQWDKARKKAGINKPFHGLRKLRAISLAEKGATVPELMAVMGHASPKMATHYVKQADKMKLVMAAYARLAE